MFYRPKDNDHGMRRNPWKALVSPRPIAWVASLDGEGRANLAPFSYFNALNEAPPLVAISVNGLKPTEPHTKDTLRNILETKEYSINLVSAALGEAMNTSSAQYEADVDEFEKAGLEKADCVEIAAPRVAASPASFECRLWKHVELPAWVPEARADLLIGEVVGVHIDDAVIREGRVDVTAYQPLARLGYLDYAKVDSVFQMKRPSAEDDR